MPDTVKIKTENLFFAYKGHTVLKDISASFMENRITAITGPSGEGKSTFLMTLNRLWEIEKNTQMKGTVLIRFNGELRNIYDRSFNLSRLRRKVGTVFQTPNPLPMSIMKNVAFPLKLAGRKDRKTKSEQVESALKRAGLWEEVKDRLKNDARSLSGGQQQRLCFARALVLSPEVLLLDEPTSSLDTESGRKIEELIVSLKSTSTIIMISHSPDQISRIADTKLKLSGGRMLDCPEV